MCFMVGPMIGLIGSAVSAAGSMAQSNAAASQQEYNAQVAKINARTARQQGLAQSETIARKYERQGGQMVAALAKGGVDVGSGSAALVRAENDRNSWLDQNNAIWNRETEAIGNENKARDLEAQAKAQRKAGPLAAAGSFLSGLGKVTGASGGLMINET